MIHRTAALRGQLAFFAALLGTCCLVAPDAAHASPEEAAQVQDQPAKPVPAMQQDIPAPLELADVESSYVGSASFKTKEFDGDGAGTQEPYGHFSESQFSVDYGHRFHLFDKVYLKLGAEYERFDFSTTRAPLPSSLQSLTGTVALEYVVMGEVGATITTSPGVFYTDINSVRLGNFDSPTAVAINIPLGKTFFLLLGGRVSILARHVFFPFIGATWLITDHLRIQAVPPNPRIIYSMSKQLDFYFGAELLGEAYKRDDDESARPQDRRFNGSVVDFSETRVGGGITYSPIEQVDIDLDGGWSISRDFDYYRGESTKTFNAHGAPYARISISASF